MNDKELQIFLMIIFLKIWTIAFVIGLVLLFFRSDATLVFSELLDMFVRRNVIAVLFSAIITYCFLPLTIPYSIKNILTGGE